MIALGQQILKSPFRVGPELHVLIDFSSTGVSGHHTVDSGRLLEVQDASFWIGFCCRNGEVRHIGRSKIWDDVAGNGPFVVLYVEILRRSVGQMDLRAWRSRLVSTTEHEPPKGKRTYLLLASTLRSLDYDALVMRVEGRTEVQVVIGSR